MTFSELSRFFKLKEKIAHSVYEQLHNECSELGDAIATYQGVVFKEINIDSYDALQHDYLKSHGIILSAMYGVLEPDMVIHPYRLDMTKTLADINLYNYWKPEVDEYFINVDTVVNLASVEFSKMLKNYKGRLLNIHFKEEQSDGKLKVITVRAKQARGLMFDYMVTHCIEDVEAIKNFCEAGYVYRENLSNANNWYFVKSS